jgi:hypothetical protein
MRRWEFCLQIPRLSAGNPQKLGAKFQDPFPIRDVTTGPYAGSCACDGLAWRAEAGRTAGYQSREQPGVAEGAGNDTELGGENRGLSRVTGASWIYWNREW